MFRGIDPQIIGDTFYSKLFLDNPKLRNMFPRDMHAQYQKLMNMLNTIVHRLETPGQLTNDIIAMAERHVAYGVRPAHYKMVGDALLWTLEKGLGKDWNPAVKNAWANCYEMLAGVMIGGK